jgi:alpha-beta hydrolase superfamily lysophospholipase
MVMDSMKNADAAALPTSSPVSSPDHKILAVVLHGYTFTPEHMSPVIRVIEETVASVSFLVPRLPLDLFSTVDPVQIARDVIVLIEKQISFRDGQGWKPFEEILLIGHSLGALLARKIYLLAGPESSEARFEDSGDKELCEGKSWFPLIKRIVLLAGMNRGWSLTHHLHISRMISLKIGTFFGDIALAVTGRRYMIFHIRRGAPFITELRMQWLALHKTKTSKSQALALTVQLLGTIDDLVAPTDNIDLVTGRDFIYLDVPFSGHANVIEMDISAAGQIRREVFQQALVEDPEVLARRNLVPEDLGLFEARRHVTDVIFVIHGIRDVGYWTQKIARRVEALGNAPPKIYASETSSYGYFAMFPFLLPSRRREKVQWLMDQYVEAKSLYPDARFSFVGHSNGTYLLANALEGYRACRFQRVVFAGSVVRTDYDWTAVIRRGQIQAILNYVATADWVVACFPGALETLNLQDLGSAGHNGFKDASPGVFQCRYIPGAHGAALTENNWDEIARFIISSNPQGSATSDLANQQNGFVVFLGRIAPLVWLIVILLLFSIGRLLWGLDGHEPIRTLIVVAYLWIIWQIFTRV